YLDMTVMRLGGSSFDRIVPGEVVPSIRYRRHFGKGILAVRADKGPSASLVPLSGRSTYGEYASRPAFGRRLAAGPFSTRKAVGGRGPHLRRTRRRRWGARYNHGEWFGPPSSSSASARPIAKGILSASCCTRSRSPSRPARSPC